MRKDFTNERDFERRSVRFDIKFKRFRSGCVTSDAVGITKDDYLNLGIPADREMVYTKNEYSNATESTEKVVLAVDLGRSKRYGH